MRHIPLWLFAFGILATGCATSQNRTSEPSPQQKREDEMRSQIQTMSQKIEMLETRLSATQDGLESTRAQVDNFSLVKTGKVPGKENVKGVSAHPSDSIGASVEATPSSSDPEAGFVQEYAIKAFRQAMILFKGQKYPEAVLAFTAFLEGYADHPLAGTAQFHVGEAYYLQKEFKLAKPEFERVLTAYDLSPYVPFALRRLSDIEPNQKKYQQLLLSLYPSSPPALQAKLNTADVEPAGPVHVTRPVIDSPPDTAPAIAEPPPLPLETQ